MNVMAPATRSRVLRLVAAMALGLAAPLGALSAAAAGPPFPDPVLNQAVYDTAEVFRAATIGSAEGIIDAIEARTGAEVVVYSQVVDYGITTEDAGRDAQALMDQWGIGRKGFDDGLVILFDLDPSRVHGQVILYGGAGYRAAFLDNAEKQRIFEDDMLPLLRAGDLDGALMIALQRVDANATPEHAQRLQLARQVDALVGLVGAPTILFGLIGSAVFAWLRYGRDPAYLDDPSVHMAGPPRDLTPAAATLVLAGRSSRRALTTAILDLASRGIVAFRDESDALGRNRRFGIDLDPPPADEHEAARRSRNGARPLGPAEQLVERRLRETPGAGSGYLNPVELQEFGASVGAFDSALERHIVEHGWFREPPSSARSRWGIRGALAVALAVVSFVPAIILPSAGLVLVAIALLASGVAVIVLSRSMDAVTIAGAMIRAMLAAYRRTLEKTMAQARSMDQVVDDAGLEWLETPDQAVVWGTALGLEKEIEAILERSLQDIREGRVSPASTYLPIWLGAGVGSDALGAAGADGGIGGGGGGLLSSSAIPKVGGMFAALGTIGTMPSAAGSGVGGGSFGGGSSGGGGGASGGGF